MKISIIDKQFEQKVESLDMAITEIQVQYRLQQTALMELQLKQDLLEQALEKIIASHQLDPAIQTFTRHLQSLREEFARAEKVS